MYEHLIFDIDNTIFDFDASERSALDMVFQELEKSYSFTYNYLKKAFFKEKKQFKYSAGQTASSHSKYLQFKAFFLKLNIPLCELDNYTYLYNKNFEEHITVYPLCKEFLEFCKSKNIKLYCLSNNTCKEQVNRIKSAKLLHLFDNIYTSEEFGLEKPDTKLYTQVLHLINANNNNTAIIGDSYINDIQGANNINMYAFWFHKNNIMEKHHMEFNNYSILLDLFTEYYELVEQFEDLSKYMGERFDLVQAGGGNTSFKMRNYMFIKSSGCSLVDISMHKNYVGVQYNNIKTNMKKLDTTDKREREKTAELLVNNEITFLKQYRPSIETTMHSLTNKYTVHLHPIQFNMISGFKNCKEIIKQYFPEACFIEYFTPGIDVALELLKIYNSESIIFLKNHGIVFTHNDIRQLYNIIDETILILEKKLGLNFSRYRFVNTLSTIMSQVYKNNFVSYLSEDNTIDSFINTNTLNSNTFSSFFPDKVVYCGNDYVEVTDTLENNILTYAKENKETPKIFVQTSSIKKFIYISSLSLKKCKEIESVLKAHFICYNEKHDKLHVNEINYLNNWDAEIYRIMM